MTLTDLSIRHRLTVYVLVVFMIVAGVGAYTSLPRESFPEVEIPLIVVYTGYLGASPEDVETLLTRPIETELKGVVGIKEIRSTSSEGLSVIEVEFNPDVDLDTALQKVRERVDLAKAELPADIDDDPSIQDVDFSQIPVLVVSLAGEVGLVQLKEIAEELKDDLEAIAGVNRVNVIGGREREVHVYVDPRRLSAHQLGLADIVGAVLRENLTVPGGEVDIGRLKYLVRIPAEIKDPRELESIAVDVRDGVPIYLRDVATIVYGFEDETTRARLNGRPSVTLTIEKRTGANIIAVADTVKAELDRRQAQLPAGVDITVVADMSKDIRMMVSELENNIVAGLLLVICVLMAFLGLRNSTFVAVAIPLSMLISFAVPQALGYTLNMVVLFSLILVLGMLVDNAIVIVESIYHHREEGADGPTAASRATREVMLPVMTSTITTCCAFAPLVAWPGIVGGFMRFLAVTLITGLTASLLVALVVNPTLCAYFMKPPTRRREDGAPAESQVGSNQLIRAYERLLLWLLEPAPNHGSRTWFLKKLAAHHVLRNPAPYRHRPRARGVRGAGCRRARHADGGSCDRPRRRRLRAARCAVADLARDADAGRVDTLGHGSSCGRHLEHGCHSCGHGRRVRCLGQGPRVLSRNRATTDLGGPRRPERHESRNIRCHRSPDRGPDGGGVRSPRPVGERRLEWSIDQPAKRDRNGGNPQPRDARAVRSQGPIPELDGDARTGA